MKFKRHLVTELSCGIVQIHGFAEHSNVIAVLEQDLKETLQDPLVHDQYGRGLVIANLAGSQIKGSRMYLGYEESLLAIGFRRLANFNNPRTGLLNVLYGKELVSR